MAFGWDEATEREALRAWLETVPESDRTPWAAFCLGASRYKLVADQAAHEQQRVVVELRERVAHVERQLTWLEPDASRWLGELTRARARIFVLERLLSDHGIALPSAEGDQPTAREPGPVIPPIG